MSVRSCLILGGGIGGLALADQLSAQGVEVTLVEREKFLGGLCRRIEIDGSGVDLGPHVLRTQRKPVFDYWIELIGSDLRPMTQTAAKMLFQNTFMSYPVKPAEILSRLPKTVLFNSAKDLLIEKLKSKLFADRSKTFEDWVVHTYGRSLYDVFFCPLTEKVWGVHPKYLDVEYGRKRIPPLSLRQTLLGIKPKTAIHPEDPAHSPPHFPKLGVFELCDKMINRASSRGARILRGASVTRLDISASGVSAEVKTADGTTEEVQTDYVVSTIPLPGLAKLLGAKESFSPENLAYRGVGFLFLSVPDSVRSPACVIYCADKNLPFNRISDFSYFSKDCCAPGKNILCVEYQVDETPEAEINRKIIESMQKTGVADMSVIHATRNDYAQYVYPVYRQGYKKELTEFMNKALTIDKLLLMGRQGLFVHANSDEVTEQAIEGADIVLNAPLDRDRRRKFYSLES